MAARAASLSGAPSAALSGAPSATLSGAPSGAPSAAAGTTAAPAGVRVVRFKDLDAGAASTLAAWSFAAFAVEWTDEGHPSPEAVERWYRDSDGAADRHARAQRSGVVVMRPSEHAFARRVAMCSGLLVAVSEACGVLAPIHSAMRALALLLDSSVLCTVLADECVQYSTSTEIYFCACVACLAAGRTTGMWCICWGGV